MARTATIEFTKNLKMFEYDVVGLNSLRNFLIYAEKVLEPCVFFQKKYDVNYDNNKNITMNSLKELKAYAEQSDLLKNAQIINCIMEFAFTTVEIRYNIEDSTAIMVAYDGATILSESSFERIADELMLS